MNYFHNRLLKSRLELTCEQSMESQIAQNKWLVPGYVLAGQNKDKAEYCIRGGITKRTDHSVKSVSGSSLLKIVWYTSGGLK